VANVTVIIGSSEGFPGGTPIAELWQGLQGGAMPAAGAAEGGPWRSRARLLLDAAARAVGAAGAARLDSDRAGLFVSGDEGDGLAAEAAGELGLRGPVTTLSGPPLAAVERAAGSLAAGECDLALAGGVSARGDGVWALALARLPQALAAGDPILALVRGADLEPAPPPLPWAGLDPGEAAGEPAPPRARPELGNAYAPPANPLEAAIAAVWQEQLGVDRVGVDDNFFELGGTSIAGVKIIALLKGWLHQDIPTVSLYEGPTVRALARVLLHTGPARGYDAVRERGERRRRKLQRLQGAAQDPTD